MGSGLRNMADRLAALRGQLEIGGAPGLPDCGSL
jgi:signal transduction histidine kinase